MKFSREIFDQFQKVIIVASGSGLDLKSLQLNSFEWRNVTHLNTSVRCPINTMVTYVADIFNCWSIISWACLKIRDTQQLKTFQESRSSKRAGDRFDMENIFWLLTNERLKSCLCLAEQTKRNATNVSLIDKFIFFANQDILRLVGNNFWHFWANLTSCAVLDFFSALL